MSRQVCESELLRLQDETMLLGSLVTSSLLGAARSLQRRDLDTARRLIDGHALVARQRLALEARVLALLAKEQPSPWELQVSGAMLWLAAELQRVGDGAAEVARSSLAVGARVLPPLPVDLFHIADLVPHLLHAALQAFARQMPRMAGAIPAGVDEVHTLCDRLCRAMLDPSPADAAEVDLRTHLLATAHSLERTAAAVASIHERTLYLATGDLAEARQDALPLSASGEATQDGGSRRNGRRVALLPPAPAPALEIGELMRRLQPDQAPFGDRAC